MHPDLGMALWERGARATVQVVVGTRWDVIHDYGEYREITGALYDVPIADRSENPLGAYCVTLRTKQTKADRWRGRTRADHGATPSVPRSPVGRETALAPRVAPHRSTDVHRPNGLSRPKPTARSGGCGNFRKASVCYPLALRIGLRNFGRGSFFPHPNCGNC